MALADESSLEEQMSAVGSRSSSRRSSAAAARRVSGSTELVDAPTAYDTVCEEACPSVCLSVCHTVCPTRACAWNTVCEESRADANALKFPISAKLRDN